MPSSLVLHGQKTAVRVGRTSLNIPNRTAGLLYVSDEQDPSTSALGGISIRISVLDGEVHVSEIEPSEPSTIYTALSVTRPSDPNSVSSPSYFPSYSGLTPEQRWIYLNWLEDVTQPVDIGYVFVYYYGLERQLLTGNFENAFDEVLLLREGHAEQPSFDIYSRAALLNAAVIRNDKRRLEQLYRACPPARLHDTDLILLHRLGQDFGVEGLMRIAPTLRRVNKRYIKAEPEIFKDALEEVLVAEFGTALMPFSSGYALADLPKHQQMLFANISFPSDVRTPRLPSFLHHEPFLDTTGRILKAAHDRTKTLLAQRRKEAKSTTST